MIPPRESETSIPANAPFLENINFLVRTPVRPDVCRLYITERFFLFLLSFFIIWIMVSFLIRRSIKKAENTIKTST